MVTAVAVVASLLDGPAQVTAAPLESSVVRIALAAALGMFLGLEREWSQKTAGIRTFSLISLLAAVFVILDRGELLVVGGVLVIAQGVLLAVEGLLAEDDDESGLSLTTSVSMLVAYGVGALVAAGYVIESVTVAVLSSLLLVLKRELHDMAWGLSREEIRSAVEFAILAFVVYPLLPAESTLEFAGASVRIEPQVAWLMVVMVAGIGIVNYGVVMNYGGRGIAVTGFFGGLASSAAVVGTMIDHVRQRPEATAYALSAVLLANAAMAMRNLGIALVFSLTGGAGVLYGAVVPLGAITLGSFLIAAYVADWSEQVEMSLENPFSLRNALAFGAVFFAVLVAGSLAEQHLGSLGFYATAAVTGLVSSAGATASAVMLYRVGDLAGGTAVIAILLATASSILVKVALAAVGPSREFAYRVAAWSAALIAAAGVATALATI